jgi:tetratricopeptide (TPR) repeat protein
MYTYNVQIENDFEENVSFTSRVQMLIKQNNPTSTALQPVESDYRALPQLQSSRFFIAVLLGAMFILSLTGCAAQRYREKADAALLQGDVHHAARLYQLALSKDAKFANDPKFAANFHDAQWRSALAHARQYTQQRNWQKAIDSYDRVLELNPNLPAILAQATAERIAVSKQAANAHYDIAVTAADRANQSAAISSLEQALHFQSDHNNAKAALASLQKNSPNREANTPPQFQAASASMVQRGYQSAANTLQLIIATQPTFFPARLLLHHANAQLDLSRKYQAQAAKHLSTNHLCASLRAAELSLTTWPNNTAAQAIQTNATTNRTAALAILDQVNNQRKQANWPTALDQASTFIAQFADHPQSHTIISTIKSQAATYHVTQGQTARADKQNPQAGQIAEAHFRKALAYQPKSKAARTELANLYTSRGRGAASDKLPGNAYLWFVDAHKIKPTVQTDLDIKQIKTTIFQSEPVTVELGALANANAKQQPGNYATTSNTNALKSVMLQQALKGSPPAFALSNDAFQSPDKKNPVKPNYSAAVELTSFTIDRKVISRKDLVHTYNVRHRVANPNIQRLEFQHRIAENNLSRARRNLIRQRCHICSGAGHIVQRTSSKHTKHRKDAGKHDKHDKHNHGSHAPASTRHRCNHCAGSGHIRAYDKLAVRRAQAEVDRIHHALAREPRYLEHIDKHTLPYTVEVVNLTANLNLTVEVKDLATGRTVRTFQLAPKLSQSDAHTIGANPSVGVPNDALNLPSDNQVKNTLISDAGKQAFARITDTAIVDRANQLIKKANDDAANKQPDLDIENRVRAALLLQATRPNESAKLLKEIREQ